MAPSCSEVHVVIYRDEIAVTVVGVYTNLADANAECLSLGDEAGIALTGGTGAKGDDEPVRWDSAAGVVCWVETHQVKGARS
jgi:hypothetical protein